MAVLRNVMTADTATQPSVCSICGRRCFATGVLVSHRPIKFAWGCVDHLSVLERAKTVQQRTYDHWEMKAIEAAGDDAGAYLDKIGKTDLGQLTGEEWAEFCRTMCLAFGPRLAQIISSDEAPF